MIDLQIVQADVGTVIALRGRFDAAAVVQTRSRLERLLTDNGGDIYVDLSDVTFIDSSGLGILVFLFKRLTVKEQKILLIGPSGQPRRLIEFLRIDHVIDVWPHMPAFTEIRYNPSKMPDENAA